ncbi:Ger(x)C family spore germination protein [Ureibacillus sp. NPDC094379]
MKKSNLIYLLIFTIFLSGCWDAQQPERMYYGFGLGIDYKDGKYEVYVQLISFANVAKSQQENQDVRQAEIGYATGKDIDEAVNNLYHSVDEVIYWGHLTFVIFSENALKNGNANSAIDVLTRLTEARYNTWVYSTDDDLKELLVVTPILEKGITLTKLGDPINTYKQDSYIDLYSIRKLIARLHEPSYNANIPYVKITKIWETKDGLDNESKVDGIAVVTPTGFQGFIKGKKADGLQWLSKKTKRTNITTKVNVSSEGNDYLSFSMREVNYKVEPVINGTDVKFDITIRASGKLDGLQSNINKKMIEKEVAKQVKKEVMDTFKAGLEMDVDVYRLSEVLYRKNVRLWKQINQDGKVPLNEDSIQIHFILEKISSGRKEFEETITK